MVALRLPGCTRCRGLHPAGSSSRRRRPARSHPMSRPYPGCHPCHRCRPRSPGWAEPWSRRHRCRAGRTRWSRCSKGYKNRRSSGARLGIRFAPGNVLRGLRKSTRPPCREAPKRSRTWLAPSAPSTSNPANARTRGVACPLLIRVLGPGQVVRSQIYHRSPTVSAQLCAVVTSMSRAFQSRRGIVATRLRW